MAEDNEGVAERKRRATAILDQVKANVASAAAIYLLAVLVGVVQAPAVAAAIAISVGMPR